MQLTSMTHALHEAKTVLSYLYSPFRLLCEAATGVKLNSNRGEAKKCAPSDHLFRIKRRFS